MKKIHINKFVSTCSPGPSIPSQQVFRMVILVLAMSPISCSRVRVNSEIETPQVFSELERVESSQVNKKSLSEAAADSEGRWWRSLNDPQLNAIVEGVFSQNLQLAQAKERVTQMRSLAIQAGSQRWPSLNLDLGWSRTKQLNPFSRLNSSGASSVQANPSMGAVQGAGMPSSFTQDNFRASLAVSYELDVWGRIGSLTEAAELDAIASEGDLKAIVITMSASAVDVYFQIIETQSRLSILEEQLSDDEAQLEVILTRFTQGLSPQIEVLQQTQQRDRTRAQLPPVKALLASLQRRLAALRGETRLDPSVRFPKVLPQRPSLPPIGLPASLLETRPDIQSARARLSAADARVSAAVSARLPGLRFGTNVGYQSFEYNEIFDDLIWSVSSNLLTPLFQGGRLKAEQKRTESVLRMSLLALKEKFITAYHEVEDAIGAEVSASEQFERVSAQLRSAEALFESAQHRYLQGVGDFLTTLTARQGLFASQLAVLSAERAALSARVQLHRALGGNNLGL